MSWVDANVSMSGTNKDTRRFIDFPDHMIQRRDECDTPSANRIYREIRDTERGMRGSKIDARL
jgi:hypothetical protein